MSWFYKSNVLDVGLPLCCYFLTCISYVLTEQNAVIVRVKCQGYGGMGYYNPMNYWGYPPQGYPPQGYPPMPPAGYAPPYGQGYGYGNYG